MPVLSGAGGVGGNGEKTTSAKNTEWEQVGGPKKADTTRQEGAD
jgi:hypothetical protein